MQARLREDLVVQNVAGEMVVFDPLSTEAHRLNDRATQVFKACQEQVDLPDTADVRYALALFQSKGLLQHSAAEDGTTRRQALQVLGKVALLPAITTALLPAPVAAMSGTVTEADCIAGVVGACGQTCSDGPFPGVFVCGTDGVNPGCGCISAAVATATGCAPNPC